MQQPQMYRLRRSPTYHDLIVVTEINSIMTTDHFVTTLNNNDTLNKNYPESDTDSNHNTYDKHHTFEEIRPTPKPRTTTPRPISTSQMNQKTTIRLKYQNYIIQHLPTALTKEDTLIFDENNLICHGKGWQDEFKRYPDQKFLTRVRTSLEQSHTTTLNTNNSFAELYKSLQPQTSEQQHTQNCQVHSNTTSSNTAEQDLLTSTFDESSPPTCEQPNISPIILTKPKQTHPNQQHNLEPQYIN